MKNSLTLKASSFSYPADICIPDDTAPLPNQTAWRAQPSSRTCVLDANGKKTGTVHVSTLEEYNVTTGVLTGVTKPNTPTDANYIADYQDTVLCVPDATSNSVTLQVGVQGYNANQFYFIAVLSEALASNITVTFAAQYRQNGQLKQISTNPIVIPAGQTSAHYTGGNYDNTLGEITEYHSQISFVNPANPNGKTIVKQEYSSAGGAFN